jgi:hypothetical protein
MVTMNTEKPGTSTRIERTRYVKNGRVSQFSDEWNAIQRRNEKEAARLRQDRLPYSMVYGVVAPNSYDSKGRLTAPWDAQVMTAVSRSDLHSIASMHYRYPLLERGKTCMMHVSIFAGSTGELNAQLRDAHNTFNAAMRGVKGLKIISIRTEQDPRHQGNLPGARPTLGYTLTILYTVETPEQVAASRAKTRERRLWRRMGRSLGVLPKQPTRR